MAVKRHIRQGGANQKGVTIDRDKTSINLNENMDSLVPASKSRICRRAGYAVRRHGTSSKQNRYRRFDERTGIGGVQDLEVLLQTDFDMKEIKKEEAAYVPLPKFYTFKSREERERILYRNFVNVGIEVKEMIKDVLNKGWRNRKSASVMERSKTPAMIP